MRSFSRLALLPSIMCHLQNFKRSNFNFLKQEWDETFWKVCHLCMPKKNKSMCSIDSSQLKAGLLVSVSGSGKIWLWFWDSLWKINCFSWIFIIGTFKINKSIQRDIRDIRKQEKKTNANESVPVCWGLQTAQTVPRYFIIIKSITLFDIFIPSRMHKMERWSANKWSLLIFKESKNNFQV